MSARNKANDFLRAMNPDADEPLAPAAAPAAVTSMSTAAKPTRERAAKPAAKSTTRKDLKHFGGYLDDETLEKIALLRIRLKKDNSQLIKFAIEELHRKHMAKRAFGDA